MSEQEAIPEAARLIPVVDQADVVVAGGGPAGIAAAAAASRAGARTLLVERYGFLGGTAAGGLMTCVNGFRNESPPNKLQAVKGFAQELMDELIKRGGAAGKPGVSPYCVPVDPEVLKVVASRMILDAGARVRLHSCISAVSRRNDSIAAIILESKSGREAVTGKVFVDATGDADVAARAGAPFDHGSPPLGETLPPQLMFRMACVDVGRLISHVLAAPEDFSSPYHISPPETLKQRHVEGLPIAIGGIRPQGLERSRGLGCIILNGQATFWGGAAGARNCLDSADMSQAELLAREETLNMAEALRRFPGFENARLVATGVQMGVRETRRIRGLHRLTFEEAMEGKRFPDVIAISANPLAGLGAGRPHLKHEGFDVPYGCLVPRGVANLLCAGRCISVDQKVHGSTRAMASCMATGQAAGVAAALAAAEGTSAAGVGVSRIQKELLRQGAELRAAAQ